MRRLKFNSARAAATIGVLVAMAITAGPAEAKTTVHKFTQTDTLAVIRSHDSTSTYAGEIRNSVVGKGAELLTSTLSGSTGHSKAVGYYGFGTTKATSTFKLGAQRANGDIPMTVKGKLTGGTGRFSHLTGTFSGTGVVKAQSGIVIIHIHGTARY